MFCPKCRNEYRDGFTLCNDCGVALTADLPDAEPQITADPDELVLLIAELDQARLAVAKGVLDLVKIPYEAWDTFAPTFGPFAWRSPSFRLYVAHKDAVRATAELREGFKELMGSETSYPDEK